jgi:hypothetical protein
MHETLAAKRGAAFSSFGTAKPVIASGHSAVPQSAFSPSSRPGSSLATPEFWNLSSGSSSATPPVPGLEHSTAGAVTNSQGKPGRAPESATLLLIGIGLLVFGGVLKIVAALWRPVRRESTLKEEASS